MKKISAIAARELSAFFDSVSGYILLILFLGITGFFTWLSGNNIFFLNQADLFPFFSASFWTLFFFVPALTMRSFAEEQHSGTIELLLTHPVDYWHLVLGKFLGVFYLILIALLLTLPYYITVALIGKIDNGATISGYIGLILLSAVYISIGIFSSTLSKNQIVAFLIALGIGVFFQIIFDLLTQISSGTTAEILQFLSFRSHFQNMIRGVIDSQDIIFFFSMIFFFLYASVVVLFSRKYK